MPSAQEDAKAWKKMYDGAKAAYLSPKRISLGWCNRQQEYGYFIDGLYSGPDLDGVFCDIGNLVESRNWDLIPKRSL